MYVALTRQPPIIQYEAIPAMVHHRVEQDHLPDWSYLGGRAGEGKSGSITYLAREGVGWGMGHLSTWLGGKARQGMGCRGGGHLPN